MRLPFLSPACTSSPTVFRSRSCPPHYEGSIKVIETHGQQKQWQTACKEAARQRRPTEKARPVVSRIVGPASCACFTLFAHTSPQTPGPDTTWRARACPG